MENPKYKRISSGILRLQSIQLKLVVSIPDEETFPMFRVSTTQETLYHDTKFYLSLMKNSAEFSNDNTFLINDDVIGSVVEAYKALQNVLTNPKTFTTDKDGRIMISKKQVNDNTFIIENSRYNKSLKMFPTVIEDSDGVTYEGIRMYFNTDTNLVDVHAGDFHSLAYKLNVLDLDTYSQQLLIMYKSFNESVGPYKPQYTKNPFDKRN